MPYSELHRRAKGQWESSTQAKMNSLADDLAFVPDNEFVELLWENGQIVMQGQTSKTRKGSLCPGKAQDKDGDDAVLPVPAKNGRYGPLDSVLHDLPLSGQEGNVGLVQDDEMVPWLNYPLDDSFERDYYSDIFPELSGVNLNSLSGQANTVPVDKSGNYGHGVRDSSHRVSSHSGSNVEQGNGPSKSVRIESEPTSDLHSSSKVRTSQLSSFECKSSLPTFRSGVPEFVSNNHQAFFQNSSGKTPVLATGSFAAKIHQQDPRPSPASNMGAVNFSHFARPAALVRANLQNTGVATGLSSQDKLRSNAKMPVTSSNLAESSLVDSSSVSKNVPGPMLPKVDLQSSSKLPQESLSVEQSEAICQDEASGSKSRDRGLCQNSSFGASAAFGRSESGKAFEPVVTSSSVCSGSSAGRSSKDHKHGMKRKSREVEESGYQSEDVEGESVDVKKPSTGRSTNGKRSRAAEVHNLSERRRRDRINEKMRALQELIPNCNKVDKASMLDEAIEYLKTLQMQVQIMSMGSGLCMPPMMLPTGMQHMHTPHMARFSPMGVGMGMGMGMGMSMGFGMGMLDMSCSTSYPLIPVPSMHGAQIPCPSISGATSLPGVHGSGLQIFGIPGQGLSMPMPHGPYVPLSGFPGRTVPAPDMPTPPNTSLLPESVPTCSSKDQMDNINSQKMHKSSGDCS